MFTSNASSHFTGSNPIRAGLYRRFLVLGLLSVLLLSVSGCDYRGAVGDGPGESLESITIGLLPIVDSLPFFVADQQGYFTTEGVEVNLQVYQSALLRDTALQAREVDGFLGDILAALALRNAGYAVKIASISLGATPAEGRFAILAAPGSSINSVEDLKGVDIALSQNTIIEYVVDRLLTHNGFSPEDIKDLVIPRIPDRFQMLMSGETEAACLPDPLASFAAHQGAKLILDDSADINVSQTIILFTEESMDQKSEAIRRMFAAYSRAVEDINANPDAYRDLLVEKARLPEPIRDAYLVDHFPQPQVPTVDQVEEVIRWMDGKGLLEPGMTYEEIVTDDFVSGK